MITEQTQVNFSGYGQAFQEKIIQALLTDKRWAEQISEVIKINYFDKKYLAFLAKKYFDYHQKYRTFPTLSILITLIKDELKNDNDELLKRQIVDFINRIRTKQELEDLPFVKDKCLDFCKRQALKEALEKSVDLIENEKYEAVVDIVKNAIHLGTDNSVGMNLYEDETRFEKSHRNAVPTGFSELDKKEVLDGGLGGGEIGMCIGASSSGKSHWLVQIGANALRLKKNVIHYTLEMTDKRTAIRYDANLCGISANEVPERKEDIKNFYKENKFGKLFIKQYPMNFATATMVKTHIDKLFLKGFSPDLILIDYADLMRSSKKYDALRLEVEQIYRDVKNLATELNIPVWTASQSNRASANSDIVGLDSVSEAYGKSMLVDLACSISRKLEEKAQGTGRFFIVKNRNGVDGIGYQLKIDTSRSKFELLSQADPFNLDNINENPNLKNSLKNKWNNWKKDNKDIIEEE